jgi:hypothetical protein
MYVEKQVRRQSECSSNGNVTHDKKMRYVYAFCSNSFFGSRTCVLVQFESALMIDPHSEVVLLEYAKILSYGL